MGFIEWATDPWGLSVPIHIGWFLIWVSVIAGLGFLTVHAVYVRYFAKARQFAPEDPSPIAQEIPQHVQRHSLAARSFHWVMAAAMLVLLFTAFLPKVGIQFSWVTYHWIAGVVLTASIVFHVFHASFWLDFRSIWPDRIDLRDGWHRILAFVGWPAPSPRKFAKYPLENKLYHGVIMITAICAIATGVFMMFRVRTVFFVRNPYLFSDITWGTIYVLHGLAGVGLIALIMVHIYFGVRPEKLPITRSMIFGWMTREFYLHEHDPKRWVVAKPSSAQPSRLSKSED
jgi:cytochrome b subunit of formate dehydrogenase